MNSAWVSSAVAYVLTEPVDIRGTRSGTVTEVLVREGDMVGRGQHLIVLSAPSPGVSGSGEPTITLRSSTAGLITRFFVRPGSRVQERDRLLSLMQDGTLQVLALFEASALPETAPGAPAIIRIDGARAGDLAGRVIGTVNGLYSTQSGHATIAGPVRVQVQVLGFPLDQLRCGRPAPLQVLLPRCDGLNQSQAV